MVTGNRLQLDDIQAALAGDRRATGALLAELTPVVVARVRRVARFAPPYLSLEDLTQEVWLQLFANHGDLLLAFDAARGPLRAYVAAIAAHVAKDVLRNAQARKRGGRRAACALPDDDHLAGHDACACLEDRDELVHLLEHLDQVLPQRGRRVMWALCAGDASPEATAAALGCSAHVVYNWRYKIRHQAAAWSADHPH